MDNRHLCRGKRIDNLKKDWVVGHYVSVPRHMIILAETMLNGRWNCFDVDPATLGRCTGPHAAKSYRGDSEDARLVFEGDVLSDGYELWMVRYSMTSCGFSAVSSEGRSFSLYHLANGHNRGRAIEIVGTIHDGGEA